MMVHNNWDTPNHGRLSGNPITDPTYQLKEYEDYVPAFFHLSTPSSFNTYDTGAKKQQTC